MAAKLRISSVPPLGSRKGIRQCHGTQLLGTVKTKTTPYHPRSDGLVERFNRTLLAILAMFVSREHDNWDDLLPFMMLAYNTTVHTSTGFTPHRLVFGEECSLPGNLVHRELRPDPPPPLGISAITHHGFDKNCTKRMMKYARSNKEPHTARKGTTTARPWCALSPLEAGSLDTTPQHIKTNCVHHGLDHTR